MLASPPVISLSVSSKLLILAAICQAPSGDEGLTVPKAASEVL